MHSVDPQLYNIRRARADNESDIMERMANRVSPVQINSRTDKIMARIAIVIVLGGLVYGAYSLGGPVYWRLYATVINPFVHDPLHAAEHAPAAHKTATSPAGSPASTTQKAAAPATVSSTPTPKATQPAVVKKKKPFDVNDYPLTKERVHALLQDNLVMITWANHHYLDFARNWVYHLKKVGVDKGYMVGAMDDEMLKVLAEDERIGGEHTWRMNSNITKNDLGWGSPNFHRMGRAKISLIKQFLDLDVTVVISDIDTAWIQNPIPYFHRYPEADILTSSDELRPTVMDDSLEKFPDAGSAFNIGIMLFRTASKQFVDDWIKELEDPKMWDQTAFNNLARKGHGRSEPPKNLWKGYNGRLTVGVLPVSIFCSGHTFFVQRKYEELGLKPYVAHATFQYSGTPGKRHRFREALLWDDPPEYFDHPKGFIHIKMDIPEQLIAAVRKEVKGDQTPDKLKDHFALVHHQLLRVRAAMAVATITGRVLILPPILCQLDKYWAPLYDGNIPGSHFKKPFICPADHVLDLERTWHPNHPPEPHWGPRIEYREYSFLQNPRLPGAVNSSWVDITVCAAGDASCNTGTEPLKVKDGKAKIAPNLKSDALAKALEGVKDVKILSFANIAPLFDRFIDPKDQQKWEFRVKHSTSVNCCLQKQPGWVWYDMFFDRPHTDLVGRDFEVPWAPRLGDSKTLALDGKARRALLGSEDGGDDLQGARDQQHSDPQGLYKMYMDAMFSAP